MRNLGLLKRQFNAELTLALKARPIHAFFEAPSFGVWYVLTFYWKLAELSDVGREPMCPFHVDLIEDR